MAIRKKIIDRFDVSGNTYAVLHAAMHLVAAGLLYLIFQPNLSINLTKLIPIALGTVVVDLDHIPLWIEKGLRGYLKLRSMEEFGKPRRYAIHNFFFLIGSLGGCLFLMLPETIPLGLFSAAFAIHLIWDFLEDIVIFDMGYGHWI